MLYAPAVLWQLSPVTKNQPLSTMKKRTNTTKDRPVNIRLESDQFAAAQVIANRHQRTTSDILRMAIDRGLPLIQTLSESEP